MLGRPIRLLFACLIVVAALGGAVGLSLPTWARYLPLALSVVLFGLPHGAVDHLVPSRLGADGGRSRSIGPGSARWASACCTSWSAGPTPSAGCWCRGWPPWRLSY
ncbi:hypothetical protein [Halolamina pelagica]|uniref:hypothetical protein n=1 Tax=Halolamina pelagica TaxID=699431 RepID=UPI001671632D|nr:hypothetical protein [Halolamina pelagica]